MLSLEITSTTDYVLCDRDSLEDTGGLWLRTSQPDRGPVRGAIVLPLRPPGLLLFPIHRGWVLVEHANTYAPRSRHREGMGRLVNAENVAQQELTGSVELRSDLLALVPATSSTDPDWRTLEGVRDGGCTIAVGAGFHELRWFIPRSTRCEQTQVELDEYWVFGTLR